MEAFKRSLQCRKPSFLWYGASASAGWFGSSDASLAPVLNIRPDGPVGSGGRFKVYVRPVSLSNQCKTTQKQRAKPNAVGFSIRDTHRKAWRDGVQCRSRQSIAYKGFRRTESAHTASSESCGKTVCPHIIPTESSFTTFLRRPRLTPLPKKFAKAGPRMSTANATGPDRGRHAGFESSVRRSESFSTDGRTANPTKAAVGGNRPPETPHTARTAGHAIRWSCPATGLCRAVFGVW